MASNSKVGKQYRRDERMIAGTKIHVGQLQWGLQTIQSWSNAVQAAESVYNPRRKPLYDLYNNIEKDPHLGSITEKRTRAVKVSEWVWDEEIPEDIREKLSGPWLYELFGQIMSKVTKGYTLIYFKQKNDKIITELVPRQNVNPELGLITKEMYGNTGIPYREGRYPKMIMEVGRAEELGIFSRIGPYVLMKKDNLVFYAYHNQLEGIPMKLYYYEPGNLTQRREIEQQAAVQGAASYLVLPRISNGKSVEVVETNRAGASTSFKDFHGIMNDEMSICVLGQTLTTSNDGVGSNALGRVHQAVEEAVNLEDMMMTEFLINYEAIPILRATGYNIPDGAKGHFKKTERMSKMQQAQVFAIVAQYTLIPAEVWYKEFGIDPPSDSELAKWREDLKNVKLKPQPEKIEEEDPEEEETEDTPPEPQKKKASELSANLNALYFSGHLKGLFPVVQMSYEDDLSRIWTQIMNGIWNGSIKPGDVDQELFELIAGEIFAEVEKGFGASLSTLDEASPDYQLLAELRENVYLFSGFKNEKTLRAASELLVDASGVKRTFNEFAELALKINQEYNINYLFAEYQNAHAQAQMASKWLDIQREKDVLPYLQVDVVLDERTRHEKWNGITRRVDDPFWDAGGLPPYDWGCRCTVRQLSEGKVTQKKLPDLTLLKEEFQFNPGKERTIFPESHPYYKVSSKEENRAKDLFGLKIPKL